MKLVVLGGVKPEPTGSANNQPLKGHKHKENTCLN